MADSAGDGPTRPGWRPGVHQRLGFYVYLLCDPRVKPAVPFYVGKGAGDRCFDHIAEARRTKARGTREYPRLDTIRAIEADGRRVHIELLSHGLDETTAFLIEAAAIDLLGLTNLKNRVKGLAHRAGREGADAINAKYAATPAEFQSEHRVVLIRVARMFPHPFDPDALYEATHGYWVVGASRRDRGTATAPDYAMAVYEGVVRAVYRIDEWFPAPPEGNASTRELPRRWGFSGPLALDLEDQYLFTDVTAWLPRGARAPLRYVNCDQGLRSPGKAGKHRSDSGASRDVPRGIRRGRSFGRVSSHEVSAMQMAKPVVVREKALLFTINKLYRSDMTAEELYEATRGVWVIGPRREEAELALAVYQGIVREVYRIRAWHPARTLEYRTRSDVSRDVSSGRWEFEGDVAEDVRDLYVGFSVGKGSQNPIRYVNV